MRQREIDGKRKKNKDRETERTDRQKEGEKERREGTERKITSLCDETERRIWLNTHKSFKYTLKTVSLPISDRFSVLLSPYPCTINTVRFNVGVTSEAVKGGESTAHPKGVSQEARLVIKVVAYKSIADNSALVLVAEVKLFFFCRR